MNKKLIWIIERYIKDTPRKGYVKDLRIKVGFFSKKHKTRIGATDLRVYATTKALKHMYDARTAQEFDHIVRNIETVIIQPIGIYQNKEGKTGSHCLYYKFGKDAYFYILDVKTDGIYIVSAYRLNPFEEKRKNYLSGYKLLWSRKVDLPSS